jgi:sphinganine-1-phosphate aldolase
MALQEFVFPEQGVAPEVIDRDLGAFAMDDVRAHWSRCFRAPADVQDVARRAYNRFLSDNGLFTARVEGMQRIETELTNMCLALFSPPAGAWATVTSGGSESIYSALHAMREWARARRPGLGEPEVLATNTTHPAFSRGCHYFGLKLVRVPVGADLRADPSALARAVTPNTVGIVGSAPCWPYGLYDPIDALGRLAEQHDLWLHVDACVGGYLAPFLERLGEHVPPWDFRVPAVRSISADLHKLGYCLKPISTILWRAEDLRVHHLVQPSDWVSGAYKMSGFAGSRTMGPIYAAWAVMRYLGADGYCRLARRVLDACAALSRGIASIDGLYVLKNDSLPLTFGATTLDLARVQGGLSARGWIMVSCAQPPLINLPVDAATDERVIETFLSDLRSVCDEVRTGVATEAAVLKY